MSLALIVMKPFRIEACCRQWDLVRLKEADVVEVACEDMVFHEVYINPIRYIISSFDKKTCKGKYIGKMLYEEWWL